VTLVDGVRIAEVPEWGVTVYVRYVTDSESDGIRHFFPKSEISRILRIQSCRIQNFCFGPTL